jgi:hypothetical protein
MKALTPPAVRGLAFVVNLLALLHSDFLTRSQDSFHLAFVQLSKKIC